MKSRNPRRILYLIGQLAVGGTERQLLYLLQNLDRTLFLPQIACLNDDVPLLSLFSRQCPIHILRKKEESRFIALRHLRNICNQFQPDIVHGYDYAVRAAIVANILQPKTNLVLGIRNLPRWRRWWEWGVDYLIWKRANLIISNSQRALDTYAKSLGTNYKGVVVPNGLDLIEFDNRWHLDVSSAQASLSHKKSHPIIVVVARLHRQKRIDILLNAFIVILSAIPHCALWIIGDGPQRGQLEAQAKRTGIADHVVFFGNRTDVPVLLQHANVGVLTSDTEGMPNVLIEYMAAQLPVVATDVGGNAEVVVNNETGILIPAGDQDMLCKAVLHILNDVELAFRYGIAGRHRVEEKFTIKRMVSETESAYLRLFSYDS